MQMAPLVGPCLQWQRWGGGVLWAGGREWGEVGGGKVLVATGERVGGGVKNTRRKINKDISGMQVRAQVLLWNREGSKGLPLAFLTFPLPAKDVLPCHRSSLLLWCDYTHFRMQHELISSAARKRRGSAPLRMLTGGSALNNLLCSKSLPIQTLGWEQDSYTYL